MERARIPMAKLDVMARTRPIYLLQQAIRILADSRCDGLSTISVMPGMTKATAGRAGRRADDGGISGCVLFRDHLGGVDTGATAAMCAVYLRLPTVRVRVVGRLREGASWDVRVLVWVVTVVREKAGCGGRWAARGRRRRSSAAARVPGC